MKRHIIVLSVFLMLVAPVLARAAIITDVQSSFDENDPFDIKLTLGYDFNYRNTQITREALSEGQIVPANKLEVNRTWHIMHVGMAIGLYKDLEFVVDLPIVMSDQADVVAHPTVKDDPQCAGEKLYSSCINDIDPSSEAWDKTDASGGMPHAGTTLFDVPFKGKGRAGVGDLAFGIRWAPWHYKREKQYPSWLLGVLMRVPTAKVKGAYNTDVGEGLFQVELNTSISRRVTSYFEPYFDLHGKLRFATDKSLFNNQDTVTQTLVQPGHQMGLKLGAEFIPWEVEAQERHVAINSGGGLDYVFEGREYSDLWEALGASPCLTMNGCDMTSYTRGLKGAASDPDLEQKKGLDQRTGAGFPRSDGTTDVEHYSFFSFWAGVDIQPVKYFQLGLHFKLAYMTPHFITFADAGKDAETDNDLFVTGENNLGDNEYNPKYLEALDEVGHRFRASQSLQYSFLVDVSGRF